MTAKFGVVEDILDPAKMDRVRVRVFGLHTDDKSLIPTESLPWAMVLKGTDSASMSGLGTSAHGLLPGSWVKVEFFDSDEQYPLVTDSLAGNPFNISTQTAADEQVEFSDSESVPANVVRDSQGAPVKDSQGAPVTNGDAQPPAVPPGKVDISKLGSVSAKYESNGNPCTINNYKTGLDSGGASYGCYQFASYLNGRNIPARNRTLAQSKNAPIIEYISNSKYASSFSGLSPATPEFDNCWRGISDKDIFRADQHEYVARKYYKVCAAKVATNLTARGQAVHEVIWSRSVQLGPGKAAQQINAAAQNTTPDVCDSKVVEMIYDYQIANIQTNFASSSSLWPGLKARFENEKKQLIAMAKSYEKDCTGTYATVDQTKIEYTDNGKVETTYQVVQPAVAQGAAPKGNRGFQDPTGKYPLRYNEPDTSRVARGVITGTPIEYKRNNVVSGASAGNESLTEPVTQYNAKYPYNRVIETPSGHLIEYDDTPGYERIHFYHRSGTFCEFHPDGKLVHKIVGSNHTIVADANELIVLDNNNRHVDGDENATITGGLTIKVMGDANLDIGGDYNVKVGGTMNVEGKIMVSDDVIAGGVSLVSHFHTNVKNGPNLSGPPPSAGPGTLEVPAVASGGDLIVTFDHSDIGMNAQLGAEAAADPAIPGHAEDSPDAPVVTSNDADPPAVPPSQDCSGVFNEPIVQSDMLKQVSANFRLADCKNIPVGQLGLMSSEIACNWKALCQNILDPIYAQFKFKINSGFRSEAYNAALEAKGYHPSRTSDHMIGCAADISMPTQDQTIQLFQWLLTQNLPFSQLIFEGTWVHVAYNGRNKGDDYKIAYTENKGASIKPGGKNGSKLPAYLLPPPTDTQTAGGGA